MSNRNKYYRGKIIHGKWARFFITVLVIFLILIIPFLIILKSHFQYSRDGVIIKTGNNVYSNDSFNSSTSSSDPLIIETPDYSSMKPIAGEDTEPIHSLYFSSSNISEDLVSNNSEVFSDYDCVILELKPSNGKLVWNSSVPMASRYNLNGSVNISSLVSSLKATGLRVIAQLSCAKDDLLITRNPTFALHTADGNVYSGTDGTWIDPTNMDAKQYIVDLAIELIDSGVDEIWLSNLNQPDSATSNFKYSSTLAQELSASDVVNSYCLYLSNQIRTTGVNIAAVIDESGLTAYASKRFTQDLAFFGKMFDRLCCFTTSDNAVSDFEQCTSYLTLGTAEYRFVAICSDSLPLTQSSAYVFS